MKIIFKSRFHDLISFGKTLKMRKRIFRKGSTNPLPEGRMNRLARQLHPGQQILTIESIRSENETTRTFRLIPEDGGRVAFFRAGQYLSIDLNVNGTVVSRPFSISSSPDEALEGNYYEITIRTVEDGFFTPFIREEWKKGATVYCSDPMGYFYYEPLRDFKTLVLLAGGTGVTPFRSIIKDTLVHYKDVKIHLFYGVNVPEETIFMEELEPLQKEFPESLKVIPVCAKPSDSWKGKSGFITADLIQDSLGSVKDVSFFICGPAGLHTFLNKELEQFHLPRKSLRRENFNISPSQGDEKNVQFSAMMLSSTSRSVGNSLNESG